MFNELMFILGLAHNLLLICIFYLAGIKNKNLLKKFGLAYLIIVIPLCLTNLVLSFTESKEYLTSLFLVIVLVYLCFEVTLDWVLKKDFRKDWRLLTPYLMLYFFANYALVIIVWKSNLTFGAILLTLYITQLILNAFSHENIRKKFFKLK